MTDLTTGSSLKRILSFSVPFLIGNLFQQFYNVADMVIVGRTLDPLAYTAVGSTGSLVWFASGAIQSLTAGFAVITAQHKGAQNEENIKRSFGAGIRLSAIISVLLSLICVIFARNILVLLDTPEDIIDRAYGYIVWIFAGLIATALYNLLSHMIRALGDSKTPLYFLIIACVINIILDYIFIAMCGMDTDGAGLATVLAQLLSGLLCILYIKKKHPLLHISRRHLVWDKKMDKSLLRVGIPMAFLNMVLSIGSVVTQFVTNGLGTFYVTAQTTAAKIETFFVQPMLSLGSAVSVFAAQNYGAGKYDRVIDGTKKTLYFGYLWSLVSGILMVFLGRYAVLLLAGGVSEDVISNAYMRVVISSLMTVFLGPLVIYKSVLQAVGRTTWTMISGFTEILARAGTAFLVLILLNGMSLISESMGFFLMCFSNPAAWLFGLLTVVFDYFGLVKRLKQGKSATKGVDKI